LSQKQLLCCRSNFLKIFHLGSIMLDNLRTIGPLKKTGDKRPLFSLPRSEDLKESFHEAVRDARKTILGPLSPGCNTLRTIQKGLYKMLPENSHQVASGRLHISLTRMMDGQNVMVSEFSSKEDLIQALICSCFVPIYCGFIPPSFRGVRYVDGGFTNLQPCSDLEAVITVSPFTGELDICPRDCPAIFYSFQIFNSSIQISVENLCRISYALFPPSYLVSGPYQCTPVLLNHLTLK
uniref:triacylglycerol lipase n=1 Tax=Terrapene triunguis TaxID=2587831 RepID=A0A674J3Q2_9SAUR